MSNGSDREFGEMKSDVSHIKDSVDRLGISLKDYQKETRLTHEKMYNRINKNSQAISGMRAIGGFLQLIFGGLLAWLWKGK